jgi:hypothetical protein
MSPVLRCLGFWLRGGGLGFILCATHTPLGRGVGSIIAPIPKGGTGFRLVTAPAHGKFSFLQYLPPIQDWDYLDIFKASGNDRKYGRRPEMTVNLDLSPELEKRLLAQALERGVSLSDYLQEIITREVRPSTSSSLSTSAGNLSDLLLNSPFAGADLNLERFRDYPRPT